MNRRTQRFPRKICFVCGWGLWVLLAGQAFGLVLHPAGEPPANWTNKPPDSVVGRWRTNASCVAIAPNYILTVRHAGSGLGASVFFGGVEYRVKQIWNEPSTNADLRVCRIETLSGVPANLRHYVRPNTLTDEVSQQVVLGGFGVGRGATLLTSATLLDPNGKPYGYAWDPTLGNTIERWGTNRVDNDRIQNFTQISSGNNGVFVSEFLLADFDDLNVNGTTSFEAIMVEFDSGAGLFVPCGNSWKVVGIGLAVLDHAGESWFRDNTVFNQPAADRFVAVRISTYAAWINGIVPQPTCVSFVAGDLDGNCVVNETDLEMWSNQWTRTDCSGTNNHCSGTDFQPDGKVDLLDFSFLASGWMNGSVPLAGCN